MYLDGNPLTYHIARWDGTSWNSCITNTQDQGYISDMKTYNNKLYAAGNITKINNVNVNRIAKWDGTNWSSVSGGITGGFMTKVYAMTTLTNKLYVAGDFGYAGTQEAFNIASWDGTQWMALDTGLNGFAKTMTADTVNNKLYVAGNFNSVGGVNGIQVNQIAGWDGNNWFSLGSSLSGNFLSMTMYHGELYVGGEMIFIGSDSAIFYIAKWDGTQWQNVLGPNNTVLSLEVFNDTLYVGGGFSYPGKNIARYFSPLTNVSEEKINEPEYLGDCIPNPTSAVAAIPYHIPTGSKGKIYINDINGKPIKAYTLTDSNNKIDISLSEYGNGMYFYTLTIDNGKIIKRKKMVLNR